MKNPFAQYPSIFYQLNWIFIGALFCFILGCVDFFLEIQKMAFVFIEYKDSTLPILVGFIVLFYATGILFDKLKDPKRSMLIGTNFFLLGFILSLFSMGSSVLVIIAFISALLGFLLIYMACITHIGVLFPIANDWKDNAFGFLSYLPLVVGILLGILAFILVDTFSISLNITFFLLLKIFSIAFMYFLISRSDVGYEIIEEEEDGETEEEDQAIEMLKEEEETTDTLAPNPNFKNTMIGVIAVYFVYSFLMTFIADIGTADYADGPDNLGLDKYITSPLYSLVLSFSVLLIYLILGLYSFYNPTLRSRQFSKINFLNFALIILITLEFLVPYIGSFTLDTFLSTAYQYLNFLIILPIFLSILTHLNIRKNIGIWLITFMIAPTTLMLSLDAIVPENLSKLFPYVSIVLLIIFMIAFRENRDTWEQRLALNESNQAEGDDEIDILDHFVDE